MSTLARATVKIPRLSAQFNTPTTVSDLEILIRNRCLAPDMELEEAVFYFNSLMRIKPLPEIWSFNHLFGSICRMAHYSLVVSMYKALTCRADFRPAIATLNAVIRCYCGLHRADLGFSVLASAVKLGIEPNAHTLNVLLHELCSRGSMVAAMKLFERIVEDECPVLEHSYAIVINGLCRAGETWRASELLKEMCSGGHRRRRVTPISSCFCPLINKFFEKGLIEESLGLYDAMTVLRVLPDLVTCNTLIRGLCKSGHWRDAHKLLVEMESRHKVSPDLRTFNVLLHCLCSAERFREALSSLAAMISRGIKPDVVTFNSLLSGLSKSGRWRKASQFSKAMGDLGISPDSSTFAPVVDAMCKEGRVAEAFGLVQEMSDWGLNPSVSVYNSLIYGLCILGRWREGMKMLDMVRERGVEPCVVTFTILADALGKSGRTSEALKLLKDMVAKGLKPDDRTRKVLKRIHRIIWRRLVLTITLGE